MPQYADLLLNSESKVNPEPKATSYSEQLLSGELPGQKLKKGSAGFSASLKASIPEDVGTKIDILAAERFPDDPDARQRFGVVNDEIVFINDLGQLEKATGGFVDFLGGLTADAPEIIAGTAAGITTKSPVIGGALGGVAGKASKQIGSALLLDEPQTTGGNIKGQAAEFGFGLVGGVLGEGFVKFLNRNATKEAKRITPALRQDALDTIKEVQRVTGIELDLAQVTDLPMLKAFKKWAAKFPGESSEVLDAFRKLQDGQAEEAVRQITDAMAKGSDPTTLGIKGMNAARASIEAAKLEAAQISSPLYKAAFAESPVVDVENVVSLIDSILPVAKGARKKVLSNLLREFESNFATEAEKKAAKESGQTILETNLEALHNVKMHIDSLIDGDADVAINKFLDVDLQQIQAELLGSMDEASEAYARARVAHGEAQERLVKPLKNSIIGTLARLNDTSAMTAGAKMFSGRNVSPLDIRKAKKAIQAAERANPELLGSWDGLVKQWLEESFNKASKEIQSGQVVNFAGKFRQAVFGTSRQKLVMREALGQESIGLFNQVMNAFEMMARTPISGSDTAFNQLVAKELSTPSSVLKSIVSPLGTITSAIDDKFMQANADKLALVLTQPEQIGQLKNLTKLSNPKERALRIVTFILGIEGGGGIAGGLTTLPEQPPTGTGQTPAQAQ